MSLTGRIHSISKRVYPLYENDSFASVTALPTYDLIVESFYVHDPLVEQLDAGNGAVRIYLRDSDPSTDIIEGSEMEFTASVARRLGELLIACAEDTEKSAQIYGGPAEIEYHEPPKVEIPDAVIRSLRNIEHAVSKPERDFQASAKASQEHMADEARKVWQLYTSERKSIQQISTDSKRIFGYHLSPVSVQTRITLGRELAQKTEES